jgi:hypothetical protein
MFIRAKVELKEAAIDRLKGVARIGLVACWQASAGPQ